MPEKLPMRDPIGVHKRKVVAARRVGESAQCACGEARPEALIRKGRHVICAECQRRNKGKSIMEKHHVEGKANSPVAIPVPANDHRADWRMPPATAFMRK